MKTSEQVDKIYPAFIKAQADFGKAIKDSKNPFFKSDYADLNAYLKASAPGLQTNGLGVFQDAYTSEDGLRIMVTTRLIHTSGQWVESEPLAMTPTDSKPQSHGSAETYCRRYSFSAFLAMGTGKKEDDDGNKASEAPKKETTEKATPNVEKLTNALFGCRTEEGYDRLLKGFTKKYGAKTLQEKANPKDTYMDMFTQTLKGIRGENE